MSLNNDTEMKREADAQGRVINLSAWGSCFFKYGAPVIANASFGILNGSVTLPFALTLAVEAKLFYFK